MVILIAMSKIIRTFIGYMFGIEKVAIIGVLIGKRSVTAICAVKKVSR